MGLRWGRRGGPRQAAWRAVMFYDSFIRVSDSHGTLVKIHIPRPHLRLPEGESLGLRPRNLHCKQESQVTFTQTRSLRTPISEKKGSSGLGVLELAFFPQSNFQMELWGSAELPWGSRGPPESQPLQLFILRSSISWKKSFHFSKMFANQRQVVTGLFKQQIKQLSIC